MVMRRVPVVWEDGRLGLPSRLMGWLRLHVWTLSITRRVRLPWVSVAKIGSFDRKQGRLLVAGLLSRCQDGLIALVHSSGCKVIWVPCLAVECARTCWSSTIAVILQFRKIVIYVYADIVKTLAGLVPSMPRGGVWMKGSVW
jgi:hypothetical protein